MRSLLIAVAVVASTAGTPLLAQSTDEVVARGNQVFQHWCAPCHAPGPRHPGTNSLEILYKGAKPAALEDRTDLVPEFTRTFVRTGVSMMAPFRKTEISDTDLDALAAYLAPTNHDGE
jgi:mono/diheme cytochrome c family protein